MNEQHLMSPPAQTSKVDWVDYAKGIGIVLVVYGHVARGLVAAGIMSDSPTYRTVDTAIYGFHMPLFFFLSGLWLESSLAKRGKLRLLANKVDTIVYPFLTWSLLQFSIEASTSSWTNGTTSWAEIWSIPLKPIAHFWFLHALFIITAICTIFFYPLSRIKTPLLLAASTGFYFITSSDTIPIQAKYVTANLIFFVVGSIAYRFMPDLANARLRTSATLIAGPTLISVAVYLITGTSRSPGSAVGLIHASCGIALSIGLATLLSRARVSLIYHLGAASMAIYLAHIIAGSGTRIAIGSMLGVDSAAVHIVAGTIAGLFIPLGMSLTADRFGIYWLWRAPAAISAERAVYRCEGKS